MKRGRSTNSGPASRSSPAAAHGGSAIAIVVSRYNGSITSRLLEAATAEFRYRAGPDAELVVLDAPGAFELCAIASAAAATGRFAGVLALGCIIKGETSHDQYLAHAVAHGLVEITLRTAVPVSFGVLTVDTVTQAEARSGGRQGSPHGNKGQEAMSALLDTVDAIRALAGARAPTPRITRAVRDKAAARKSSRTGAAR